MENKTKSLPCEIVRDLLPLYHDKVVNETTEHAVKEHLDACEPCAKEYAKICQELPEETDISKKSKTSFESWRKKLKKRQNHRTIWITCISCIAAIALVLELCHDPLIPIKPRNGKITEAYKVENANGESVVFLGYNSSSARFGSSFHAYITTKNNKAELKIKQKVTLLEFFYPKRNDTESHILYLSIGKADETSDIEEICYKGKVIWTKSENNTTNIPPYVYSMINREWDHSGYISWSDDSRTIVYETGKRLSWNLKGDVIKEAYEPDAENKYFNGTIQMIQEDRLLIAPDSTSGLSESANLIFVSLAPLKETSAEQLRNLKEGSQVRVRYHAAIAKGICAIYDADRLVIGWSFDEF